MACEDPQPVVPDGNHNAGLACRTCHDGNTVGAPIWTVAGTLYTDTAGTAPVTAATIIVTDSLGVEVKIPTANNGNFWTTTALTPPFTVKASKCPDTRQMTGQPQTGDCNSCHGPNARIHLP